MEAGGMARPIQVTPAGAMNAVMRLAAGQLAYATRKVAELDDHELFVQGFNPESGAIVNVPHHWLALQRACMADLAKYGKMCADAGIAERGAVLAEKQTEIVATLLEKVVESLDLTPTQRDLLGPAIRREMTVLEGTPIDVADPV
jgi:hypothetical protein